VRKEPKKKSRVMKKSASSLLVSEELLPPGIIPRDLCKIILDSEPLDAYQ
jgi:hypothetical protein